MVLDRDAIMKMYLRRHVERMATDPAYAAQVTAALSAATDEEM